MQYGLAVAQKNINSPVALLGMATLAAILVNITNLLIKYFLNETNFWLKMDTMT